MLGNMPGILRRPFQKCFTPSKGNLYSEYSHKTDGVQNILLRQYSINLCITETLKAESKRSFLFIKTLILFCFPLLRSTFTN